MNRPSPESISIDARSDFKSAELIAVVTRADGTVEDLGVIARGTSRPSLFQRLKGVLHWHKS